MAKYVSGENLHNYRKNQDQKDKGGKVNFKEIKYNLCNSSHLLTF